MELRVRESAVNFRFLNAENVKDSINKPFLDFNKLARKTIYIQKSNCAFFIVGFRGNVIVDSPWELVF